MNVLKSLFVAAALLFSGTALAGPRVVVRIGAPVVVAPAPRVIVAPAKVWVPAVVDARGVVHPGYWRPAKIPGRSFVPGYTDRFGAWHPGHWR